MRIALLAAAVVVAGCTQPEPAAQQVPPDSLTYDQIKAPRDHRVSEIAGVVRKDQGGTLMLDSGGPNAIPLRVDGQAKVILDGQPATSDQIREGDLVRAAYRFNEAGEAQAVQVVANSKPVRTDQIPQEAAPQQQQMPQARAPARLPRR